MLWTPDEETFGLGRCDRAPSRDARSRVQQRHLTLGERDRLFVVDGQHRLEELRRTFDEEGKDARRPEDERRCCALDPKRCCADVPAPATVRSAREP